jgi:thiol-disulfide isomerase/thioredoxin
MSPLAVGTIAPEVPGVEFGSAPVGLFFFKVTCPTCQLAAPTMQGFERAFPGHVVGVGQDPRSKLDRFAERFDMGIRVVEDERPYLVSSAYELDSVPTLYLVGDDARVLDVVGAWERDGFNRVAATLAERLGEDPVLVSTPDDGLPDFKPG